MARRSSRLISVALLAVGAVAGGAAPSVAADGGTPQIGARVRVQVSGLCHTRAEPTDPDEWTYAGETWRDLSIVTLRESEQRCPVQDR